MKFLLPHRFKKIGSCITPLGLLLWLSMQLGYLKSLLIYCFGQPEGNYEWSTYHIVNIIAAVLGLFAFLSGLYFISFSKEKLEDEMIERTRRDSFQFAAFVQLVVAVAGFLFIQFAGDPGESGMMLFLIVLILLFWLSFIGRMNYVLYVKLRQ